MHLTRFRSSLGQLYVFPKLRPSTIPGIYTLRRFCVSSESSHSSGDNKQRDAEIRETIMKAALNNVPELGWTDDAVAKAVKEVGYDPLAHKMIDHGAADLVRYFMHKKRLHVHEVISTQYPPHDDENDDNKSGTHAKIVVYEAIACHMEYISPYKSTWPSALAVLAEPTQLSQTLEIMIDTVDDICHLAGMNSSRLDWYTDRALILLVFATTEMYMLTDYSENMKETKIFLQKNVEFWQSNIQLFHALKTHTSLVQSLSSVWEKIVTGFLSETARRESNRTSTSNSTTDDHTSGTSIK